MKSIINGLSLPAVGSFTCVVHCLLSPLLVACVPYCGTTFQSIAIEGLFLIVSICCGLYIIRKGFCVHNNYYAVTLFIMGALMWVFYVVSEHVLHSREYIGVLYIGCVFVLGAYYINHRLLSCCDD